MAAAFLQALALGFSAERAEFRNLNGGCDGKRKFANRGEALLSLKRRKGARRFKTKVSHHVHPYQCRSCGKWHVGGDAR